MKKFNKIALVILTFVFGLSLFLGSPLTTYAIPASGDGVVISNQQVPTLVKDGDNMLLPVPTVTKYDGDPLTVDPADTVISAWLVNNGNGITKKYYFNDSTATVHTVYANGVTADTYTTTVDSAEKIVGSGASKKLSIDSTLLDETTYYLTYKVEANSQLYYTNQYKIVVQKDEYTLELEDGIILPSTINKGNDDIVLPNAVIYDENGDEVTDNYTVEVYYSTSSTPLSLSTDTNGRYTFKALNDGEYRIYYSYNSAKLSNYPISIVADPNFDATEITLKGTASFPVAYLNEAVTLPKPSVSDENGNSINVVTTMTVKYNNNGTLETVTVTDGKFTPTQVGKYIVTYSAVDYFGNIVKWNNGTTTTLTYTYNEIKDSKAPTLVVAEDYDSTTATLENVVNAEWAVPTVWGKEDIYFPAIYGWDAVSDYSDLTFVRKLVYRADRSKVYDIDDDERGKTVSGADATYDKGVVFNFKSTETFNFGDYDVIYRVQDESGKYTEKTFVLSIKDYVALTDNDVPVITLNTIDSYINPTLPLSFKKPSAVDKNTAIENAIDNNVRIKTYYFYGEQSDFSESEFLDAYEADRYLTDFSDVTLGVDLVDTTEVDSSNSNNYLVNFQNYTGESYVTILVVAFDDGTSNTNVGIGNVAFKYHTATLANVTETGIPTIQNGQNAQFVVEDDETKETISQNETIIIPSVTFADTVDSRLTLSVKVFDKNSNAITVYNNTQSIYGYSNGVGTYLATISNAKFDTTVYGKYKIVYTATDAAGNSINLVRTVECENTTRPIIEINNTIPSTLEFGESMTLPYGIVRTGEGDILVSDLVPTITGPSYTSTGYMTICPQEVGTYTVAYTYTTGGGIEAIPSPVYTIEVSDTTDPTIESMSIVTYGDADKIYSLPELKANDASGIDWSKSGIKVTKGGEEITLTYNSTTRKFEFDPDDNKGEYVAVYTAVDNQGRKTTQTYTIKIGDYEKPVIDVEELSLPTTLTKNGEVVIDLNKIVITDKINSSSEATAIDKTNNLYGFSMVVTDASGNTQSPIKVTDEDGTIVEMDDESAQFLTYKFEEVGKYTITITINDENNNVTTKTLEITVRERVGSATLTDDQIGVILIIVSLVLLAGVILYFVLTGRKSKLSAIKIDDKKTK